MGTVSEPPVVLNRQDRKPKEKLDGTKKSAERSRG